MRREILPSDFSRLDRVPGMWAIRSIAPAAKSGQGNARDSHARREHE
jgi:hypothetical protein